MAESVFLTDGDRYTPTAHARGPWDPGALHGGAPAALMAAVFEQMPSSAQLSIARLSFEFVRPIPFLPLTLSTRVVRSGRRVQELSGELRVSAADESSGEHSPSDQEVVCRASALRVRRVPDEVPRSVSRDYSGDSDGQALPAPESGEAVAFSLDGSRDASFATTAMEMRWLSDAASLGPGRVWMRLRRPLVGSEPPSPLARLAATADFGNGVSATLPFERFVFINADLTIHLQRLPQGEWIGLDARTLIAGGGTGLAESVLHDEHGAVGRAFQTLVVQPRS